MHPFPRQASSGGASSSSDATTAVPTSLNAAGSSSSAPIASQTSALTSAAVSTSGQLSSLTSTASSSSSAELRTSSTSPETTPSTSSSPSTSPSRNTVSSTTSHAASSSSIGSQATSYASSSVPSSITTQPPASDSLQQEITTTITSAYTTYIDGSQILTSTSFPSTIPEPSSPSSSGDRTAIIAGSAAGGTAFIILILSFAFCVRRKRFKKVHFLDAITLKRKQARSRATLLDGEDLDNVGRPPHGYSDYETPWDGNDRALMAARHTLDTPAPATPSRWAETGSAFREEVWPPPNEATRLMDPLANRHDLNIDLGRIVDDVMGPSHTRTHFSDQSISSVHRGSVADSQVHSRTTSNASNAALLEAAGLGGSASNAPVRPSPLAQQGTTPASVED